mmetsp:Transcript_38034/g.75409  ORF Transcript_38034/g.75409 Transcript_38034/m.75409 type:complete len:236 (+) Transcript_38034:511-1218(+)
MDLVTPPYHRLAFNDQLVCTSSPVNMNINDWNPKLLRLNCAKDLAPIHEAAVLIIGQPPLNYIIKKFCSLVRSDSQSIEILLNKKLIAIEIKAVDKRLDNRCVNVWFPSQVAKGEPSHPGPIWLVELWTGIELHMITHALATGDPQMFGFAVLQQSVPAPLRCLSHCCTWTCGRRSVEHLLDHTLLALLLRDWLWAEKVCQKQHCGHVGRIIPPVRNPYKSKLSVQQVHAMDSLW